MGSSFSRDKPSLITNFSFGGERLSISPLIRYELDGFQPWGFDIWWDYKIKKVRKIQFFYWRCFPWNCKSKNNNSRRKFTNNYSPTLVFCYSKPSISYFFNKNFGLNLSYFEIIPLKLVNTNQIESGRVIILSPLIKYFIIKNSVYLKWEPLLYALQIEDTEIGFFSAQTINFGILNFPFSISTVMNKPIDFGALTGKNLIGILVQITPLN